MNRLQYRHEFRKDIKEPSNQVIAQQSLNLKFEITVKLNKFLHHP